MKHIISSHHIDFEKVKNILHSEVQIELGEDAKVRIQKCRDFLDQKIDTSHDAHYGINTGFGSLYNKSISKDDLEQLQVNLMMSHACGIGDEVPEEIVRLMLFLKVQGLCYGNSGVQVATVQLLIDFLNHGIYPIVFEQGSLGASGDLSPLAHLCLPLIGLGEVRVKGEKMPTTQALKMFELNSVSLKSKEGLALLNGTQFMSAYGVYCILKAQKLERAADMIAALSLEGFDGRIEPFHHLIHQVRPHSGQINTATRF